MTKFTAIFSKVNFKDVWLYYKFLLIFMGVFYFVDNLIKIETNYNVATHILIAEKKYLFGLVKGETKQFNLQYALEETFWVNSLKDIAFDCSEGIDSDNNYSNICSEDFFYSYSMFKKIIFFFVVISIILIYYVVQRENG